MTVGELETIHTNLGVQERTDRGTELFTHQTLADCGGVEGLQAFADAPAELKAARHLVAAGLQQDDTASLSNALEHYVRIYRAQRSAVWGRPDCRGIMLAMCFERDIIASHVLTSSGAEAVRVPTHNRILDSVVGSLKFNENVQDRIKKGENPFGAVGAVVLTRLVPVIRVNSITG